MYHWLRVPSPPKISPNYHYHHHQQQPHHRCFPCLQPRMRMSSRLHRQCPFRSSLRRLHLLPKATWLPSRLLPASMNPSIITLPRRRSNDRSSPPWIRRHMRRFGPMNNFSKPSRKGSRRSNLMMTDNNLQQHFIQNPRIFFYKCFKYFLIKFFTVTFVISLQTNFLKVVGKELSNNFTILTNYYNF